MVTQLFSEKSNEYIWIGDRSFRKLGLLAWQNGWIIELTYKLSNEEDTLKLALDNLKELTEEQAFSMAYALNKALTEDTIGTWFSHYELENIINLLKTGGLIKRV